MTWRMTKRAPTTTNVQVVTRGETLSGSASTAGCVEIAFTVLGQCWSLKNGHGWGRGRSWKNPKAVKFEKDFLLQVPPEVRQLGLGSDKTPLRANVSVYYPSWRQDVDVEIVWDLLQKAGVVSNDRWIREKHIYGHVDKDNPRVEIRLEEI